MCLATIFLSGRTSMSRVILTVLLVLSGCSWTPAGGQTCSLLLGQFSHSTVTVSAESVNGSRPAARVTWNTTAPPECVASVRVEFRTSVHGPVVATYTTTNTAQTEFIQTGLQCGTNYYITVDVTGALSGGVRPTLRSRPMQVLVGDIPTPVGVRAEVTADNTSIRVSWQWSHQGLPMCADLVQVRYQPEGGSPMMYTVGNTTATTNATLSNLQCNTEYTVWVLARSRQTEHSSVRKMAYLPARAPPMPTEVTAWFTSVSSVRVAWQWTSSGPAPNCFNTTTVTYRPVGGGESSKKLSDPAANEATLTDLQCNTTYTITVVATAGEHRRERATERVTLPQQDIPHPIGVRAEVNADNTSIRVSWQWLCKNLLTYLDLVQVHYQPERGSLMMHTVSNTPTAATTSAILSNLQCNTKYNIAVHVESGSNKTGNTSVSIMVSLLARAPPIPTGVTAQFTSPSSIMITWQWTSSGPAPDCFNTTTVNYRPEGGGESSLQLSEPAATAANLTDLKCNTSYTITVVTTAGGYRRERTVFNLLQGPQSLSATVLSPTSVRLTWVAPCHTQQYHIYYRGRCGAYVDDGRLESNQQECTVNGLQGGISYTFTVNQTGFSGGRVLSIGPVYARTFTAVPSGVLQLLEAMFVQLTNVFLRWRQVPCIKQNGPIAGYVVRYYATCGADSYVQRNKSVVTTDSNISGLIPYTEYAFQVAAVNVNGTGPFSKPITLRGTPQHPQLMTVTPVNSTTVTVSWSEVQCFNGSGAVTHYLVQYQSMCGGAVQNVTTIGLVQTVNISGLTPHSGYTFQVAVADVNRTGLFSEPITLGGGPQLVTVTPVYSTTVTVSWSEVQCFSRSGPVTHYLVQYQSMCGGAVQNVTTNGLVQTVNILSLTPNGGYTFQVAAADVNGYGPFSETITLEGTGGPQLVTVTPVNSTTVNVSWSEVQCFNGSGPVTHYIVKYKSMCGGAVQNVTTYGLVQTVSGLVPNVAVYAFRVAAVGASQKIGPFSNPVSTSLLGAVDVCPEEQATPHTSSEVLNQCTSAWAVAGVAIAAVLFLLVMAFIQSAVIWHLTRGTAKTAEISLKECSAYGQIDQGGGEREETHIYEHPQ